MVEFELTVRETEGSAEDRGIRTMCSIQKRELLLNFSQFLLLLKYFSCLTILLKLNNFLI